MDSVVTKNRLCQSWLLNRNGYIYEKYRWNFSIKENFVLKGGEELGRNFPPLP